MRYDLPSYASAHVAAIVGVVALHGGMLAWQMMPSAPIAIPQQQIIQISMVAPSTPQVKIDHAGGARSDARADTGRAAQSRGHEEGAAEGGEKAHRQKT